MDTTEQYIEMCKMAGEIQKQLPELAGATAWPLGSIKFIIHEDAIYYLAPSEWLHLTTNKNFTWLPQQDDLQKMVIISLSYGLERFIKFTEAIYDGNFKPVILFDSMEQLWLSFVMKELHSKTWGGDKWAI